MMKNISILLFAAILSLFNFEPCMAQGKSKEDVPTDATTQSGIRFFQGSFQQALNEAKKQHKPLFVDFYAQWCGPCKRMAKTIFTQDSIGKYFNEKFISIQIDAEKPENVAIAKQYKIEAFPTLAFIANDGKAISISVGAMGARELLEAGKTAAGDVIGFKELYEQYRANPSDLDIQQKVLQQAPKFLMAQEGMDAEKWVVRIRKMFSAYIQAKLGPSLINRTDYLIITQLGGDDIEQQQKIADFINTNLPAWQKNVGDAAAYYVIEYNDKRIEDLAKEGNLSYKDYVAKISGEYKPSYSVISFVGNFDPAKSSAKYADAIYVIYKDKDIKKYLELMDEYFKLMGENATPADYGKAAQNLYYAAGKKLAPADHEIAINWVEKALTGETSVVDRINYLVMIGDSYTAIKKYEDATKYYRQGYVESLQLNNMTQVQAMIQATIARKLATLELLQK